MSINAPFISATTTAYTPTVSASGTVNISVPFFSSGTLVYTPAINPILTPFIPAVTTIFDPILNHSIQRPLLKSISGHTDKIILEYNKLLDTSSIPSPSDFDIEVNASPRGVTSVEISGRVIILTLASSLISSDTVIISYTS